MKRRRIIIAVLLVAALGGIAWLAFGPSNRPDPIYKGKPLSKWLVGYESWTNPVLINPRPAPPTNISISRLTTPTGTLVTPSATPESVAADEALEHFGTNAIPTIAWMLRKHDPAWRVKLLLLLEKQHSVPIYHNNPFLWNFAGLKAMEKLGKSGEAAVPVMAEIYDESLQAQSRTSGYIAWGDYMALALPPIWDQLGPPARGAIPSLLRGATFTNGNVRAVAMITLGKIRSEPRLVIPVLTNAFRDPDVLVRQNALIAVSEYGKDAEPAIPAIAEMLNDKEHWVQTAALDALMRLHANPAVTIPALTPSLESTDVFVTLRVARVLLRFGPDARPAVPKMIEAFNRQTDERVRLALRRIIEEIEPGAMARAGIQ